MGGGSIATENGEPMVERTQVQRIGAYGIAVNDGHLLLSRISTRGYPAGYWNLPGGGLLHGEAPPVALQREFWEETGLAVSALNLVDVTSTHLAGSGPTDALGRSGASEDFHGLAILYRVSVTPGAQARVVEVDGTTDAVEWVPLTYVRERNYLTIVDHALNYLSALPDESSSSDS